MVGVIGHCDDLFLGVKLDEGGDWPKCFSLCEEGGGGDVREDGKRVEGADVFGLGSVGRLAANEDVGTECGSILDVSGNFGDGTVMDEWAMCSVRVSAMCIYCISWSSVDTSEERTSFRQVCSRL